MFDPLSMILCLVFKIEELQTKAQREGMTDKLKSDIAFVEALKWRVTSGEQSIDLLARIETALWL